MKWDEYLKVISEYGFEVIFQREIGIISNKRPTLLIAAHPEKYLLLRADSSIRSGIEIVNTTDIYGEVEAVGQKRIQLSHAISDFILTGNIFEFDCKNEYGFVDILNRIETISKFTKWHRLDKTVWLSDYSHSHDHCQEYYHDFIAMAPDWVLNFLLPESGTPETPQ